MTFSSRALPTLFPLAALGFLLLASIALFGVVCLTSGRPRTPYIEARASSALWKWCMEWWIWFWAPFERACIRLEISPNAITLASALLSIGAGLLLGSGRLVEGGWLYLFAASLDLVDGRVARARNLASKAGAFLDSTLDRVAEMAAFAGLAVYFQSSPVLLVTLAAAGASFLVSYARARGEALGIFREARVGGMQRAERILITGLPCALSSAIDVLFGPGWGRLTLAWALVFLAITTTLTAVARSCAIWCALCGPKMEVPANVRWLDAARRRTRHGH